MHSVEKEVLKTIKKYNMISPGDSIIIGLSGGPDSVCLLNVLASLRSELGIDMIHAVHINHGLRGEESDGDEQYARRAAEAAGAGFDSVFYNVSEMAADRGMSVEAMGRKLRYGAFRSFLEKYGAQRIAVAHNRNDRAETVLMRIIRGTGIRGLNGIEYAHGGVIIRPLLDIYREEIEAYCSDKGLEPRIDSTNNKTVYTRNRVRLKLLPEIENDYNPKFKEALIRLSEQASEADDLIRGLALDYLDGIDSSGNIRWDGRSGSLSLDGFDGLHPAAAKRAFIICAERMGMEENISSVSLQRMMDTALFGEPAEADMAMGSYVLKTYGRLWFIDRGETGRKIEAAVPVPFEELEKNGSCIIRAGNCVIEMNTGEWKGQSVRELRARGTAVLDLDKLLARSGAVFRNRRAGDRIRPKGMSGSKKLQDHFTDRKIPRHLRDGMTLIADGDRILLAGTEVSQECVVEDTSERVLYIRSV